MIDRVGLIARLSAFGEERPEVNAAWLGGSDAFGAADAGSDVDLCLDVADGAAEAVLDAIEASLEADPGLVARWAVPAPTWHGHAQRFFRLADAPETLLVDVVAIERSTSGPRFDEREQHGEPVVLFDRLGVVRSRALDLAANDARIADRLVAIAAREALFGAFPAKEAGRDRALDALHFYTGMLILPLVEVLRIRYCPERAAFGMRYLHRDLPGPVAERLARLAFVADLDDLRARAPEARAWLRDELERASGRDLPQAAGLPPGRP